MKACGSACCSEQRLYEYTPIGYIYLSGSAESTVVVIHFEIPQILQQFSYIVRKASEHIGLVGATLGDNEVFAWQ